MSNSKKPPKSKPLPSRRRLHVLPREERLLEQLRELAQLLDTCSTDPLIRQIATYLRTTINRYRLNRIVEQLP